MVVFLYNKQKERKMCVDNNWELLKHEAKRAQAPFSPVDMNMPTRSPPTPFEGGGYIGTRGVDVSRLVVWGDPKND